MKTTYDKLTGTVTITPDECEPHEKEFTADLYNAMQGSVIALDYCEEDKLYETGDGWVERILKPDGDDL